MQQVAVRLVDDLDQHSEADETIRFALDGVGYVIDLNAEHATEFRANVGPYAEAGRREARDKRVAGKSSGRRTTSSNSQEVRAWAMANGIRVSPRGRVALEVLAAYRDAHRATVEAA